MVVFGAIVSVALIITAITWWNARSLDPRRVFWGAIQNDLATTGVTISQAANNNGSQTAQLNQFDFGPQKRAQSVTTFAQGDAEVRTVELSTPAADFTKYIAIKTGKAHLGNAGALAKVLNVWADTTSITKPKDVGVPSTFPTVLLTLATPVGNFSPAEQSTLMGQIKDQQVYTPDLSTVQKHHQNGRLQYTYSVTMQPILYVQLMKTYAQAMGMHELDSVDPNAYQASTLTAMQWTVDARSRQLVQITYSGHNESYSGFGLHVSTPNPAKTIPGAALQQRVTDLNTQIQS